MIMISLEKEAEQIWNNPSRILLNQGHPRNSRGNNPCPYNFYAKTLPNILINDSFLGILNYEEDLLNLND